MVTAWQATFFDTEKTSLSPDWSLTDSSSSPVHVLGADLCQTSDLGQMPRPSSIIRRLSDSNSSIQSNFAFLRIGFAPQPSSTEDITYHSSSINGREFHLNNIDACRNKLYM